MSKFFKFTSKICALRSETYTFEMVVLKIIFVLFQLICYLNVDGAHIKCKIGLERYQNGACERCVCSRGHGLDISQMLPGDASVCPPCSSCSVGKFSGAETDHLCVNCSASCESRNRVTVRHCDGGNDGVCGQCMEGYMPDKLNICLSVDEHGRRRRQKLKEEDHTVHFVIAGIAIPAWMCLICYCIFRNRIGSWRRGPTKKCANPTDCNTHLVYTINKNHGKAEELCNSQSDKTELIRNEES